MAAQRPRQAVQSASGHRRRKGATCARTGTRSLHEDARAVAPATASSSPCKPWMPGLPGDSCKAMTRLGTNMGLLRTSAAGYSVSPPALIDRPGRGYCDACRLAIVMSAAPCFFRWRVCSDRLPGCECFDPHYLEAKGEFARYQSKGNAKWPGKRRKSSKWRSAWKSTCICALPASKRRLRELAEVPSVMAGLFVVLSLDTGSGLPEITS